MQFNFVVLLWTFICNFWLIENILVFWQQTGRKCSTSKYLLIMWLLNLNLTWPDLNLIKPTAALITVSCRYLGCRPLFLVAHFKMLVSVRMVLLCSLLVFRVSLQIPDCVLCCCKHQKDSFNKDFGRLSTTTGAARHSISEHDVGHTGTSVPFDFDKCQWASTWSI